MGFGANASLYSSALTAAVLVGSTFISIATVDRFGRRFLLISGGIVMIICLVTVAIKVEIWEQSRTIKRILNIGGDSVLSLCFGIRMVMGSSRLDPWIIVMTIFVYAFLPETKGVPVEEMIFLWRKHWFWRTIVPEVVTYETV
ncbi:hypothetical protein DITRI_Ditri10aG0163500 [Diplodiscus trichospermus]